MRHQQFTRTEEILVEAKTAIGRYSSTTRTPKLVVVGLLLFVWCFRLHQSPASLSVIVFLSFSAALIIRHSSSGAEFRNKAGARREVSRFSFAVYNTPAVEEELVGAHDHVRGRATRKKIKLRRTKSKKMPRKTKTCICTMYHGYYSS